MVRIGLNIGGIVQGVGFRPFVHRLAENCGLNGWIRNTPSGVELELEGELHDIDRFVSAVRDDAPPLASIDSIERIEKDGLRGYTAFEIVKSAGDEPMRTLVSPDVGICSDCLRELFDPSDRRYRFPFINCTNCGPRFTIVSGVPYDRAKTTMSVFPMCPECDAEYHDIKSRRYHAQPDCCAECGPKLFLLGADGSEISGDPIVSARRLLLSGGILAVKGLGGIHLACLPEKADELRRRKRRDEKPFALMCRDTSCAEKMCFVSDAERRMLESFRRPIVLLKKREPDSLLRLSENGYVGIMLPYTPVHYLLMGDNIDCLIMTSANISETPILRENGEALEKLSGIADAFLLNNRDIHARCDDSLVREVGGREYFIRRSRGFAPSPIKTHRSIDGILACGAEQKASFGLGKGDRFFLSGHIGDLKNLEAFENYTGQIAHFEKLFDFVPNRLVCDLHPDYMSSAYAEKRAHDCGLPLEKVQHHHAHLASCMADNGLDDDCIGIIWDGVGLGTDGTAWGGEILFGGYSGFERLGTVRTIPLPGGDAAVRDIKRIGLALLHDAQVSDCESFFPDDMTMLSAMIKNGIGVFPSSGVGRLFDGAAAILGIKHTASYEGQGAVLLESTARGVGTAYPFGFYEAGGIQVFDHRDTVRALAEDVRRGIPVSAAAANFMRTLIEMAAEAAMHASRKTGCRNVCLSGGVFQNMFILHGLRSALAEKGLNIYIHSRVSCTDEGISLGQAMIAGKRCF